MLAVLYSDFNRNINTPLTAAKGEGDTLTEEELFAAKTYLPLVLEENAETPEDGVNEVMLTAQSLGRKGFERVLGALTFKDRAQLLGQMLTLLPLDWQQEFLELGRSLLEHPSATA